MNPALVGLAHFGGGRNRPKFDRFVFAASFADFRQFSRGAEFRWIVLTEVVYEIEKCLDRR